MRKAKLLLLISLLLTLNSPSVLAQLVNDLKGLPKMTESTIIPKNQTSNYTDKISDLFQMSIQNGVIGVKNGTYSLKSSFYGIGVLFDSSLLVDKEFIRLKWARNLSVDIATSIDENNRIQSFNPAFKYSIVNKRDLKDLRNSASQRMIRQNDKVNIALMDATDKLADLLQDELNNEKDTVRRRQLKEIIEKESRIDISKLTDIERTMRLDRLKGLISDNEKANASLVGVSKAFADVKQVYDSIITSVKGGLLATMDIGGNYTGSSSWTNAYFKFECLKGLGWSKTKDKPWDFDFNIRYEMSLDSTKTTSNLNRQVLSSYFGLNKVLLSKKVTNQKGVSSVSILEILGSAGFDYISKGKYEDENSTTFNLDFIFSVRVSENMYLPIEIKYNPENGKVFGFIKLKWDLPNNS